MSDLISRSALLKEVEGFTNISRNYFSNPDLLKSIIENQPTAYDVDAVVAELEEVEQSRLEVHDWQGQSAILDAIDIVRKGGVKNG